MFEKNGKISKSGDSPVFRITGAVKEISNLQAGDNVKVKVTDGKIIINKRQCKKES